MLQWTWGCIYIYIFFFKLVFSCSLNQYTEMELLDHLVVLFLIFFRNLHTLFLLVLHQFEFPSMVHKSFNFFTFLTFVISCPFDVSHSNRCGFDFHFADGKWCSCTCWPSVCLLWKLLIQVLYSFFSLYCFGFWYWVVWILCIFCILTPEQVYNL